MPARITAISQSKFGFSSALKDSFIHLVHPTWIQLSVSGWPSKKNFDVGRFVVLMLTSFGRLCKMPGTTMSNTRMLAIFKRCMAFVIRLSKHKVA